MSSVVEDKGPAPAALLESQMMDRLSIAAALREVGRLLELSGENRFKVRAYDRGADALEGLTEDLRKVIEEARLTDVENIGPSMNRQIIELFETGRSKQLEHLRETLPRGILELSKIPDLSVLKIRQLSQALEIASVDDLQRACEQGLVQQVKGFGAKTEKKILETIIRYEKRGDQMLLCDVLELAEAFVSYLRAHPAAERVEVAGSVRRFQETVRDLDLVVATNDAQAILDHLEAHPLVFKVESRTPTATSVRLATGLPIDLVVSSPGDYAATLLRATGSIEHIQELQGLEVASAGAGSEAEIYRRLGLAYIPPELRENTGELEAARHREVEASLVSLEHIRGMVHCHTTYSDGRNTIEEMARRADAMGMEYITITDHSPSAFYARGVELDRLKQQWDEIARVQELVKVKILRGTESDILEDGALDYPDEILEKLDVVIASIHSRFSMDEDKMTRRLTRAMSLPLFKIWGHALGRLLLRREPFACRVEEVLDVIARSNAAIEINGDPYRLDLEPKWIRAARERKIPFTVSVDAHSAAALDVVSFGVGIARRGFVEKSEVLNALPLEEFKARVAP